MACGNVLMRASVLAALALISLAVVAVAQAAPAIEEAQARQVGTGCEPNGLPNSLALCNGSGRLNLQLEGTAVLRVLRGQVTLKGRASRVCKMRRVKRKDGTTVVRRVCSKRAKPILPRVATRKSRGYTIYSGRRLFFYLPAGTWRISGKGDGVSLSAVGEGTVGVKARKPANDDVTESGLISVGGEIYNQWPRRWTRFEFGRDSDKNDEDTDPTRTETTLRTAISDAPSDRQRPTVAEGSEPTPVTDDGAVTADETQPAGVG